MHIDFYHEHRVLLLIFGRNRTRISSKETRFFEKLSSFTTMPSSREVKARSSIVDTSLKDPHFCPYYFFPSWPSKIHLRCIKCVARYPSVQPFRSFGEFARSACTKRTTESHWNRHRRVLRDGGSGARCSR